MKHKDVLTIMFFLIENLARIKNTKISSGIIYSNKLSNYIITMQALFFIDIRFLPKKHKRH